MQLFYLNIFNFRNTDAKSIEARQKQYIEENKSSFSHLIKQAKKRGILEKNFEFEFFCVFTGIGSELRSLLYTKKNS